MNNPHHSSVSVEHYTPADLTEAARQVLGGIDLDPASSPLANTIVGAKQIFTKETDGLSRPWNGTVFVNPPGGKDADGKSMQKAFWFKLGREWMEGRVTAAIFVGFSIELLQTTQANTPPCLPLPHDFALCFPARRIAFLSEDEGVLLAKTSPTHANVIVYLPPTGAFHEYNAFDLAFGAVGRVLFPRWRGLNSLRSPLAKARMEGPATGTTPG